MKKQPTIGTESTVQHLAINRAIRSNYKQKPVNTLAQLPEPIKTSNLCRSNVPHRMSEKEYNEKYNKDFGLDEVEIERRKNEFNGWAALWPTIEGAFWLTHTYDKEILCIPFNNRDKVSGTKLEKRIYALLSKDANFRIHGKYLKTVTNKTKKKVIRLTEEHAIKACENYNVFYVPDSLTQNVGGIKWRPVDICDKSSKAAKKIAETMRQLNNDEMKS